jgi:hypothetical protein
MAHHSIQRDVDDISSKLKFVAKIQVDQRVNVKSCMSLHDKWSWTARMWRTFHGTEGRLVTYEFIKELISKAYNLLISLRHSNSTYDMQVYCKLISEMILIEPGLRNLTETYKRDDDYVTTIETLIDSLKIKVKELCDYKSLDPETLVQHVESKSPAPEQSEQKVDEKKTTDSSSDSEHDPESQNLNVRLESAVELLEADASESSEDKMSPRQPKVTIQIVDPIPESVSPPPSSTENLPEIATPKMASPAYEVVQCKKKRRNMVPIAENTVTDPESQNNSVRNDPTKSPDSTRNDPASPALLELLDRVSQQQRKRQKRRPEWKPDSLSDDFGSTSEQKQSPKDDNPFRPLKYDYNYDLECGLYPPKGLLKKRQ